MHDIFSRHRPLALLAGVVLAQILLLAFQIKREHDVRLIRYWAVQVMTPAERGGTWGFSTIRGIWTGYIDLHNARGENRQLRDELGRLQIQNRELENEANEAQRLKVLLTFRDTYPEAQMLAAQVIGASADPSSHTLFINRGARDHLHNNMAVVTPDGIVGKLVEVFPTTAQVLLINDKESGVGALFAESRTHGVVKGSADPTPRMDYVVNDEKVKAGEVVLTSGDDRIFPKGLLVGTVIDSKPALPFQMIRVQPAARLDRLEDVLILLSQQQLEAKAASDSGSSYALVPAPTVQPTPSQPEPTVSPGATTASTPSNRPNAVNQSAASVKPAASGASHGASTSPSPAAAKPNTVVPKRADSTTAKPTPTPKPPDPRQ